MIAEFMDGAEEDDNSWGRLAAAPHKKMKGSVNRQAWRAETLQPAENKERIQFLIAGNPANSPSKPAHAETY